MADFEVQISQGADTQVWTDTETPPRTNPHPLHPQRYYRVLDNAETVRFSVSAEGVGLPYGGSEPYDYQLKGRLIRWAWVEDFSGPFIPIPLTVGRSAVVEFTGQPFRGRLGHHLLMAYRPDGGEVAVPFLVEDAKQTDRDANDHAVVTDSVSRTLI